MSDGGGGRARAARVAAFGAGLAVHLATTTAFGYLVGFLLDAGVPRTVDRGGAAAPPALAAAVDLGLVALFAVPHSLLAREPVKQAVARLVGPALVRSAYNAVAVLSTAALVAGWRPIPFVVWAVPPGAAAHGVRALFWLGWGLAALSVLQTNLWELSGLRQTWAVLRGRPHVPVGFRTGGAYRVARHPLYLGFLLALWAAPRMTAGHALLAAALTVYVAVAVPFEERDLLRAFGADYERYRTRVGALGPRPRG